MKLYYYPILLCIGILSITGCSPDNEKETKEIAEKKKRRKSSRTVAEVKCRNELPAQEINDRGKNSQLEDDATGGKGTVVDPGEGECEEGVEREESIQVSRAKEVGKSENRGEDAPTSNPAGCCENHQSNSIFQNRCTQ